MPKIIMDVWGGEQSQEWVARFVRDTDDALELSRAELAAGFLVNLRADAAFGQYEEFDNRKTRTQ